MSGPQIEQLRQLAQEVVHDHDLVLYDIEVGQERGRAVIRVYVDRAVSAGPGEGVTVGECESISRELSQLFDVEEPLSLAYALEVSSPGLERPLSERRHYEWAVGGRVSLVLFETRQKHGNTLEGLLEFVGEEGVRLRLAPVVKKVKKGQIAKVPPVEEWEVVEVAFGAISKAKTVYVAP